MRSDKIKEGIDHAPHRALLYAGGLSDKNIIYFPFDTDDLYQIFQIKQFLNVSQNYYSIQKLNS